MSFDQINEINILKLGTPEASSLGRCCPSKKTVPCSNAFFNKEYKICIQHSCVELLKFAITRVPSSLVGPPKCFYALNLVEKRLGSIYKRLMFI